MQEAERDERKDKPAMGCALAILAVNTVLIGLATARFIQGPYSSNEQEFWYRYVSIAFFLAGSVLPAIALLAVRRSRWLIAAAIAWMAATLLAFVYYVMMSRGGV